MQEGQQPNEPGWVFKPGDVQPTSESGPSGQPSAQQAVESSVQSPTPPVEAETMQPTPATPVDATDQAHIEWTASEYIANPKSGGWYALLALCSIVLAGVAYFITGGDIVSTVVIAILGLLVGVFAARQPRTLSYRIDSSGLKVGEKSYPFESFKSFSVANEHAIGYISLLPLKRFMPPLIVHYAPDDEARIAQTLAEYLPYEDHKPDVIDSFTRKIRF